MFNTTQVEILSSLIPTMKNQGYKYYVAYSDTNNSGSNNAQPDLYVVFSKDKIMCERSYQFSVPDGSVRYTIRTANYSTNNSAVNTDRYVSAPYSGNLKIDVYEHIYSNADFAEGTVIMPDINYRGGGELIEKTNGLGLVCVAVLLFIVFCSFFKR